MNDVILDKYAFIQVIRTERKILRLRNKCTKSHTIQKILFLLGMLDFGFLDNYSASYILHDYDKDSMLEWAKDRTLKLK